MLCGGEGSSISRHFNTLVLCCVEGRGIKYLETFRDTYVGLVGAVLCKNGMNPDPNLSSQAEQPSG